MASQDLIGRESVVEKICNLIDVLKKDQNICISIDGEWGSGKTFVLGMLEEQLSQKEEYILIRYDAWENTFYSDPLLAILSCVIDGTKDYFSQVGMDRNRIKGAAKATVDTVAKVMPHVDTAKNIITGLIQIIKSFNCPIDTSTLENFKSYQTLLKDTKEVLNQITQYGEFRDKQSKLILLVDEIDRCLPDEQLKILERLHHLFQVNNCAVIVAMNQNSVAQTVQTIYGINGEEYLRKFFDITFRLETAADLYLENLLQKFLSLFDSLKGDKTQLKDSVRSAYLCLTQGKNVLKQADNREISRYYDRVLDVCNDYGLEKLFPADVFFILLGLYIKRFISASFLSEDEMQEKQETIEREIRSNALDPSEKMPYHDYILELLGIDREHLSDIFTSPYQYYFSSHCNAAEWIWDFNQIVYFSASEERFSYRGAHSCPPEKCRKLRDLIMLYGGESRQDCYSEN